MVLEVLVKLWHSKLFQFGRIFTQIFPSIISIDFFLGFLALPRTLLCSLLLFELHHLKVPKAYIAQLLQGNPFQQRRRKQNYHKPQAGG